MTMPQIIMLNAAADKNKAKLEKRSDAQRATNQQRKPVAAPSGERFQGKRLDQLNTEEYVKYLAS